MQCCQDKLKWVGGNLKITMPDNALNVFAKMKYDRIMGYVKSKSLDGGLWFKMTEKESFF